MVLAVIAGEPSDRQLYRVDLGRSVLRCRMGRRTTKGCQMPAVWAAQTEDLPQTGGSHLTTNAGIEAGRGHHPSNVTVAAMDGYGPIL